MTAGVRREWGSEGWAAGWQPLYQVYAGKTTLWFKEYWLWNLENQVRTLVLHFPQVWELGPASQSLSCPICIMGKSFHLHKACEDKIGKAAPSASGCRGAVLKCKGKLPSFVTTHFQVSPPLSPLPSLPGSIITFMITITHGNYISPLVLLTE